MASTAEQEDNDPLNILIATDLHLGYCDTDQIRGDDSLNTFEEILKIATSSNVDMLLLGGDLFHDNKPSRKTLHGTLQLLRKYCMGDHPVRFEVISDQSILFPNTNDWGVNYEDPNYNVGLPVFSIHGNHDDPTGHGDLAALDLLSTVNLVNYFGRQKIIDDISVYPILLQKNKVQAAIYGLGNIRDERLHRTWVNNKVQFMKPEQSEGEFFNIFVLHQNRVKHGNTNYIPESFMPDFVDVVVWGHEHDHQVCVNMPDNMPKPYIMQPGSSIATSLSEGESIKKHVVKLSINHQNLFKIEKIPLTTVRPFKYDEVVLSDLGLDRSRPEAVEERLAQLVNEMIDEVNESKETDMQPLIRLKVEYSGFESFNTQRFGQQFVKKVANPKDILIFFRKRVQAPRKSNNVSATSVDLQPHIPEEMSHTKVLDLVEESLQRTRLRVLQREDLRLAVETFVDKDEKDAIKELVQKQITNESKEMIERSDQMIGKNQSNQLTDEQLMNIVKVKIDVDNSDQSEIEDNKPSPATKDSKAKKGRSAKKATVKAESMSVRRAAKRNTVLSEDEVEDSDIESDDSYKASPVTRKGKRKTIAKSGKGKAPLSKKRRF